MVTSEELHQLIDGLPDEDLDALVDFLQRLTSERNPVERAFLRASLREPESVSAEEERLLREAEEDVAAGRLVSHEVILREFLDEE